MQGVLIYGVWIRYHQAAFMEMDNSIALGGS
jgi:hypothetical protein